MFVVASSVDSNGAHSRLSETPSEHIESHFRPMHLLCELGRIRYDFVGDLKVQADLDYISVRWWVVCVGGGVWCVVCGGDGITFLTWAWI